MLLTLGLAHFAGGVARVALGLLLRLERLFGGGPLLAQLRLQDRLLLARLFLRDRLETRRFGGGGGFASFALEPLAFGLFGRGLFGGEAFGAGLRDRAALGLARLDGGIIGAGFGFEFGYYGEAGLGGGFLAVLKCVAIRFRHCFPSAQMIPRPAHGRPDAAAQPRSAPPCHARVIAAIARGGLAWQSGRMSGAIPKISFVSLGCPKALVDSERILSQLRAEGYELSRGHAGADAVIVNTCGFLDSAKAESLEAIGAAMKENGKVIVTGCMGAQPGPILAAHPNILAITGPQALDSVMAAVRQAAPAPHDPFVDLVPPQGVKLTPRHYAYLKIAEGCDHRCSFCIIPSLRGDLVSRPAGDVLREAERLVKAGVKELLVISQDTSAYGLDLGYGASRFQDREVFARFYDLAKELGELGAWIRLHYVYPYPHVDRVIELMAAGKVLPYLDIPFQHAAPDVLRAMRRPGNHVKTLERIRAWRAICPELALRSTFIVGFPGETEADFQFLLDWLSEARIDRLGAFKYEAVAGAAANDLGLAIVPDEVKQQRYDRLMRHQQAISARIQAGKVGKRLKVIIDEPGMAAKGRGEADAPQIDGAVHVTSRRPLRQGDIVSVKIERADAYDLYGTAA